jgi:hypothetical protein
MEDCPVCLEACDLEKDTVTTCCKKIFHETCFHKCLQLNSMCPTCRHVYFSPRHLEVAVTTTSWEIIDCIKGCGIVLVHFV